MDGIGNGPAPQPADPRPGPASHEDSAPRRYVPMPNRSRLGAAAPHRIRNIFRIGLASPPDGGPPACEYGSPNSRLPSRTFRFGLPAALPGRVIQKDPAPEARGPISLNDRPALSAWRTGSFGGPWPCRTFSVRRRGYPGSGSLPFSVRGARSVRSRAAPG